MAAAQFEIGGGGDRAFGASAVAAPAQITVAQVCVGVRLVRERKPSRLARHFASAAAQRGAAVVVEIADERVAVALIGEDAILRFAVIFHGRISIEVVGREIEQHAHARTEFANGFELKTGDFGDDPIVGAGRNRLRDERIADVPAHMHLSAICPESRWPMSAVVVVLPLVPVTATMGASQRRYATSISEKTGTPVREIASTVGLLSGTPGESTAGRCGADRLGEFFHREQRHAQLGELGPFFDEFFAWFVVEGDDGDAAGTQHFGRGQAAAPDTDHDDGVFGVEHVRTDVRHQCHSILTLEKLTMAQKMTHANTETPTRTCS